MNNIYNFYQNTCNEHLRLLSQSGQIEYLTTMKYLKALCPPNGSILDACSGTGVYAFPLANLGYEVTAGDLVPSNVEQIQARQAQTPILKEIYTGSILDLSRFKDESFDVVLNFGSYYHLKDEKDRLKSITECLRVLKNGGLLCLAYLSKYANYAKYSSLMNEDFSIFENYMEKGFSDEEDIFWATTPEAVEETLSQFNLTQLHHIATDGPLFTMKDTINKMDSDTFTRWLKIHFANCEQRSVLGYSEHGLYIGRK